jgi:hypothetical protein
VDKNRVQLNPQAGTIVFRPKQGRSLSVGRIFDSFVASSLYGPNGIETVRYLEITARGEVVGGATASLFQVGGTGQQFELTDDPDSQPPMDEPNACQRLRAALTQGARVTSVTGRVHHWTIPRTAKDPDQLSGKKPLLLIVTDFQTAPK